VEVKDFDDAVVDESTADAPTPPSNPDPSLNTWTGCERSMSSIASSACSLELPMKVLKVTVYPGLRLTAAMVSTLSGEMLARWRRL